MKTPILAICGTAGVGKDAVASIIGRVVGGATTVSLADPIKRFARNVFEFTPEQLWGPSRCRNAPDSRYSDTRGWSAALNRVDDRVLNKEASGFFDLTKASIQLHELSKEVLGRGEVLSPRTVLQFIGTEVGRSNNQNAWFDYAVDTAEDLLVGGYTYDREKGLVEGTGTDVGLVIVPDCRFRNEILGFQQINARILRVVGPENVKNSISGIPNHPSEKQQGGVPGYWYDYILHNSMTGLDLLESEVINSVLPSLELLPRR